MQLCPQKPAATHSRSLFSCGFYTEQPFFFFNSAQNEKEASSHTHSDTDCVQRIQIISVICYDEYTQRYFDVSKSYELQL